VHQGGAGSTKRREGGFLERGSPKKGGIQKCRSETDEEDPPNTETEKKAFSRRLSKQAQENREGTGGKAFKPFLKKGSEKLPIKEKTLGKVASNVVSKEKGGITRRRAERTPV